MGVCYDEDEPKAATATATATAEHDENDDDDDVANLRVAVFGAKGRMGRIHCENLRALGVKTVVAVDLGDEIPAEGTVDAAVVCSPSDVREAHLNIVSNHLGGVPVYCEKPLAFDWATSLTCAKILSVSGVKTQMGFQRRFDPETRAVRRDAAGGKCEPLHSVSITSRDPKPPPKEYITSMGSHFADMTIHDLDEARWMLGASMSTTTTTSGGSAITATTAGDGGGGFYYSGRREPNRVYATMNDEKTRATVVLKTPEGQHCVIVNDRTCALGYDQRVEVAGGGGITRLDKLPKDPDCFFSERYAGAYLAAMRSFLVNVVVKGGQPEVDVMDALHAANLARACDESLATGREVEVPPLPV